MATQIVVPRLGWSMDEGVFSTWLKQEGEHVSKGEFLFELEGEKATQEVETFHSGILAFLPDSPQPGDTVRVGQILGYLLEDGEDLPAEINSNENTATEPENHSPPPAKSGVAVPATTGSPRGRIRITPRARRAAASHGVDWTTIRGSGQDGRIREQDILQAANSGGPTGALQSLSSLSQAFIRRWETRGKGTLPVTLHRKVDAMALQEKKEASATSYNAVLLMCLAKALRAHPALNSCWSDNGVLILDEVRIGLAVDTVEGLLAPVVPIAPETELGQVQQRIDDIVQRASSGETTAADLEGATFVVTNLGMHGVEFFTPLLNPPLCATLGVGTIRTEAVVENNEIVPGRLLPLSLTFDHRIIDGAPAARFLDEFSTLLTTPEKASESE